MRWFDLPPLNSLRAFSAVAEEDSYSRAGAHLNETHAAISQQVKALEKWLGIDLVVRQGRGIALTAAGEKLARDLNVGFATLLSGVENLTGAESQNTVQITMPPAFAVSWMMPRILDFQALHPEITLMLNPTADVVDLKPGGIDLAIRYRDRRAPGLPEAPVLIADMVIVGTPELVTGRDCSTPRALVEMPWLQELGTNEVADWLARHGVEPAQTPMITHMPGNLILEAVRRGDGITYTARHWVEEQIKSGQLVELFVEPGFGVYYMLSRPGTVRPAVIAVVNWLKRHSVPIQA
jgi:DNA-binding transcriptional LysR family regulator